MSKLLVTGASGLLGMNLALAATEAGYQVTGWTNRRALVGTPFAAEQVDLTDLTGLPTRLSALAPNLIIHCAALADIDQSEQNPEFAAKLNTQVAGVIARSALELGARLVHISTDAVFDGTTGDYRETDAPNPISVYARTKLEGETAVAEANPAAIIARVNFYGWSPSGKHSLAEFFYNRLKAEQTVNGFTDVYFTPLYVGHLARILLQMAQQDLTGLYHVFSRQPISKYAFGVSLARQFELDESLISPLSVHDSELAAARSLNLSMNTDKLQAALDGDLPGELEGMQAFYADWQAGLPARLTSFVA
ncbi:MAG: SDR family oxidoreductase [Anaerolineaceae bacterium]